MISFYSKGIPMFNEFVIKNASVEKSVRPFFVFMIEGDQTLS